MKLDRLFSHDHLVTQLLVLNGFMIALMLALAKVSTSAGIHPVAYAFWQTFIAGLLLLSFSFRQVHSFNGKHLSYFLVSGLTGIAVPNTIAFFLVSKIGSGFTGIMYALPPIFTFLISVGLGLTSFKVHKLVGLCVAVLACSWIVIQRHESTGQTNTVWFLLGLLIPVMLSIGNVYRSMAWPEGSKPGPLAAGTLLSASGLLGIYAMLNKVPFIAADLSWHAHSLILAQGCLTAATFLCSFELQTRSNPVFYSQLGSVAAVFGLVIGVLWFNERYSYLLWTGVLVLLASLRVSNLPSLKWHHMLFHFKKSANKQVLLQDSKASDTA